MNEWMNEILMHDAFNGILWTSTDMRRAWRSPVEEAKKHVVTGFGKLAAVD